MSKEINAVSVKVDPAHSDHIRVVSVSVYIDDILLNNAIHREVYIEALARNVAQDITKVLRSGI